MENSKFAIPKVEEEEQLIAAAKHIADVIRSNKKLTDEARRVLADLGSQLSTFTSFNQRKDETIGELEKLLDIVQEKVMRWEENHFKISSARPDEAFEYLNAADEARKFTEIFDSLSLNQEDDDYDKKMKLERRAHDILRKVMARLEEDFKTMLSINMTAFEPEIVPRYSVDSLDCIHYSSHDSVYRDCLNRYTEEILDFTHVGVIPKLRSIATLMFNSKFDRQCTQAYISARKNACDEFLVILKMENLSIEEARGMDWTRLNAKIKRWIHVVQIFVRVFLSSELCLCDKIFEELGPITLFCFVEATKTSMIQLLDFGESISVGPTKPERLFRILEMYEVLAALLPDIEALYKGEVCSPIIIKSHELLRRFGDYVRAAFTKFGNVIASHNSTSLVLEGGIHPLSKYVMNYIKILTNYRETLNFLFKDKEERNHHIVSSSPAEENSKRSPLARHFISVVAVLEGNLDAKSKLYRKASLQHLFLMNNIHYMARKVRTSELRSEFGEKWIGEHYWKCHQHALNYERASWGSVLSLLDVKGIQNPSSSSASKILWKERLRNFCQAFEEIYKTQTGWVIPDVELREDLRISISLRVILAYRTFMGRYPSHLSDKNIKYSADDLENYLLDLFEGSQKTITSPSKRW